MKIYDIAIIGAGPAGIMAAITAARNGKEVILIEKNFSLGRKILATGNGRCNITNRYITTDRFYGARPYFIEKVIKSFDQNKTIGFFESLGIILKEEDNGRMFPRTNQASTVVKALEFELEKLGVVISTDSCVKNIARKDSWIINIDGKNDISAEKLILTTGGIAAPQLGSSGDGFLWAKNFGHTLSPTYPSLVPLETLESWPKEVSGIKVHANTTLLIDGKETGKRSGDLLFTHYGVSGPTVMALSHLAASNLATSKVQLEIDTFPEVSSNELDKKLAQIFSQSGAKNVKNAMIGIVPSNLISVLLRNAKIDENKKAAEISKIERQSIMLNIKKILLNISQLRPLKEAQVTAGGISCDDINVETLESKISNNLYFAGEIIDVHADSGGFNLQWAWSSGFVAGNSVSKL